MKNPDLESLLFFLSKKKVFYMYEVDFWVIHYIKT